MGWAADLSRLEVKLARASHYNGSDLAQSNSRNGEDPMWHAIATAPYDEDLELAVIDWHGTHALSFPCRRITYGWVNADTLSPVWVRPTHWRRWKL